MHYCQVVRSIDVEVKQIWVPTVSFYTTSYLTGEKILKTSLSLKLLPFAEMETKNY